jgi:uncharacterized protein (TIGR03083 family)
MGEQIDRLIAKLREEGAAVQARLVGLAPDQWDAPLYGEGDGWTARDLLAHLVTAEQGHQRWIASVAAGGPGVSADFSVDRFNAEKVPTLAACTTETLLADLASVREQTSKLVAGLSEDDLARRGRHPALGEDTPVIDGIRIVYMHVRMHLRDLNRSLTSD